MTIFWALFGTASQMVLWTAFSRFHYRHWDWAEKTHDSDRRFVAGFWGFLWPLLITGYVLGYSFGNLFKVIGWAQTTPGLGERKEKKRKVKQERLKDLNRQIETAERELRTATEQMKRASE